MHRAMVIAALAASMVHAEALAKASSTLYPTSIAQRVRDNVANDPWAAGVRDRIVGAASYWLECSDDELWNLMFGPELERSWMVWSNGHSPVTGEPVPMYNWVADAKNHPWKLQDPTSGEWFPKNDFKAYYESGLDARRLFDPDRADQNLLFNTEHPDPGDPLHRFGVDDGSGYVNEQGDRWRFIGAYLIYGQWKQLVVGGIRILSSAYLLTGEPVYAHKCAILLDRVADLYPRFDFGSQAILYEGPGAAGYVSTWHDACEETRELVMAYDMIVGGLDACTTLAPFLAEKARAAGLDNPKSSIEDIRRNIEAGILRDALANPEKIHSNYPRAEILKAITTAVLQESDDAFWAIVDPMLAKATAVDGVTGEKGMAGYSSFTISALGSFVSEFSKTDPAFLEGLLDRHPRLYETFRFFIDTLCLQRYYPIIGDTGHYGAAVDRYVGIDFLIPGANIGGWNNWTLLAPSNYQLMWQFYKATGDPTYVQILYRANGGSTDGLPYDIFGGNSGEFRKAVADCIATEGTLLRLPSVNKQEWRLAILRSGNGSNERALWLDYDAGGGHGHQDGMNLGLFAHGLDCMPEMGYPPVQFGGWGSPRARWYTMTAAHNTVSIDRRNQINGGGETTLWFSGAKLHAIRAAGAAMAEAERYERTAVLVDIDDTHAYVVDVFRVRGGREHTKFQQSHFGTLTTTGLTLAPADAFDANTQTREFHLDSNATPGWMAAWQFEDRGRLLRDTAPRGMRYWDFTTGAAAGTSQAWIVHGMYEDDDELWIPRVTVQRRAESDAPLESTFVAVVEPWKNGPVLADVKRVAVNSADGAALPDTDVALTVALPDGQRDLIVLRDPQTFESGPASVCDEGQFVTDGEIAWARLDAEGRVRDAAVVHGARVSSGDFLLLANPATRHAEFSATP